MLHGSCDAGRIVRFDPFGDVLITKAANCKMVTTKVIVDQLNTRYRLPPRPCTARHWIYIMNFVSDTGQPPATPLLYLGGRTVTAGLGFPLLPGRAFALEIRGNVEVYGITDAFGHLDEIDVRILELV